MRSFLLAGLLAGAVSPVFRLQAQSPADTPRLVVLLTVDQLRADYLERHAKEYGGGLRRLAAQGAVFTRGEQDHAITETAPGHATLLSGRSPGAVGVITNELGVPDEGAPLVGVPGPGASPQRFRGTTLFDWMRAVDKDVRVLSVSRKDRGAILPIGQEKVPVYWYQAGYFTTSTWYAKELPDWLRKWNARHGARKFAGKAWHLLKPESAYPEVDDQPWERGGNNTTFPHNFSADSNRASLELAGTPYPDSLTLDVALEGARQLRLGHRNRPDLLAISLSSTDGVGHVYGPDSREMHDQLLRLDGWLGWFMDSLATHVPADQILWVLTSDHGVTSFPEATRARGRMAGRASGDTVAYYAEQDLVGRFSRSFGIEFNNGLLYGDTTAIRAAGVNVDSLASALASKLARQSGVTRIYTPKTLKAAAPDDLDAQRWRRSVEPDFPWLAAASLAPGYIWSYHPAATTHGTTNPDDVRVPIIFMGKGIKPGLYDRTRTATAPPPRTIDIAPTLAALLGVKPLEPIEGIPLAEVVGKP
jgi:predicted AlkP superfamily pyrophosphatase or phosphodiesterase